MSARKTILALCVLAALLAAYAWDAARTREARRALALGERIIAAHAAEIQEVALVRPGLKPDIKKVQPEKIALARDGKNWTMTAPFKRRGNATAVNRLLAEIEKDGTGNSFDAGGAWAKYGLDKPGASFTLRAKDENVTVALGAATPDGAFNYARRGKDAKVFTIPSNVHDMVTLDADAYRDPRLFPLEPRDCRTIEFDDGPRHVTLTQRLNPQVWTMGVVDKDAKTSQACEVDYDYLPAFFISLQNTKARRYVEDANDAQTSYGLTRPARAYHFTPFKDLGGASRDFIIGAPAPGGKERFVMTGGEAWGAALAEADAQKLVPAITALQSKALFHQDYDKVDRVSIMVRGREIALEREPGKPWALTHAPAIRLDQGRIEDLVKASLDLKALQLLPAPVPPLDSGLDNPNIELRIQTHAEGVSETLQTGRMKRGENMVYARQLESDRPVMIDWREPGKYFITVKDLEDTLLFHFDPAKVARMELTQKTRVMVFTRGADGSWSATAKDGKDMLKVGTGVVREVIKNFLALRWQLRLDPANPDDKKYLDVSGIDLSERAMRLFDAEGGPILALEEGARSPRRVFARVDGVQIYALDLQNYLPLPAAISTMFDTMAVTLQKNAIADGATSASQPLAEPQSAGSPAAKTQ